MCWMITHLTFEKILGLSLVLVTIIITSITLFAMGFFLETSTQHFSIGGAHPAFL